MMGSIDTQSPQFSIRIEISMAGETVEGNVRIAETKNVASAMVVLVSPLNRRNNTQRGNACNAGNDDKGSSRRIDQYQSRGPRPMCRQEIRTDIPLNLIHGN